MSFDNLTPLLGRTDVQLVGLALSVLILFWIARRVHRVAKSEHPDGPLSNVAMVLGLGWSSEAVWEITRDMPMGVRIALFCVFEVFLSVSMIRAKRHVKLYGWPGRPGQTAWGLATVMGVVGVFAAASPGEGLLRLVIPLALTKIWWDGLIGGRSRPAGQASSWRWTPRRLLLALGAIEPGERDVETVHRERLTQQMTRLEFRRRHGSARQQVRAARKLARLSLTADDDMISDVRRRVDRATWFEPAQELSGPAASRGSITTGAAASARARRVRHGKAFRKVHVAHPRPVIVAAQEPRQEVRETHEIDTVVRVIREAHPKLPQRQIARLAVTSEPTVRRALRRIQNPAPPPTVNDRKPQLIGVDR